jgi:hypothetical protein
MFRLWPMGRALEKLCRGNDAGRCVKENLRFLLVVETVDLTNFSTW